MRNLNLERFQVYLLSKDRGDEKKFLIHKLQ